MQMLAKVGAALQQLIGPVAEQLAKATKVIRRQREFTPLSLIATFVLGHLWKPNATVAQLAKVAVQLGATVTPQKSLQTGRLDPTSIDFHPQILRMTQTF